MTEELKKALKALSKRDIVNATVEYWDDEASEARSIHYERDEYTGEGSWFERVT
ncbi:hypothetical protein [Ruegeria conchae]|uniref:hypothetical protein n=1 Tax=Ruegeria conchae TaxID=981384 RepID=UPI0029C8B799|nr:hypothetical protein [Ruegeria conchae]